MVWAVKGMKLLLIILMSLMVIASVGAASVYLTDTPVINLNETDPFFSAANATLARIGNCTPGQFVVNTTTGGVQCAAPAVTEEGDPVFVANNGTIWGAIDGKLNVSDQQYNDTVEIGMRAFPGNCPSGYFVQNTTISGVQCVAESIGEEYWSNISGVLTSTMPILVNNSLTIGMKNNNLTYESYSLDFVSGNPYGNGTLQSSMQVFGDQFILMVNGTWMEFDSSGMLIAPNYNTYGLRFGASDDSLSWQNFGNTSFYVVDGEIDINVPNIFVNGGYTLNGNYTMLENLSSICTYRFVQGFLMGRNCSGYSSGELNESVSDLFEVGLGIGSIQAKGVKGVGQIRLITGSNVVTGIGTDFVGGGLRNLDAYYAFYIGSARYFVFPIANDTSATLTGIMFGSAINWTGANLTTDFYLVINNASGDESRAFGMGSTASGLASLALGSSTLASGSYSFASGDGSIANASGAVALGSTTLASGLNSFASGFSTVASGNTAFASGQNTVASGLYAVAMGYGNAAGSYAFAFGRETTANAVGAVSMGYKTNVTSYAELAVGRYNVGGGTFNSWVVTDPVFEVGIGSNSTNLANAFTVYKNGNVTVNNTLFVAGSQVCTVGNGLCSFNISDGSINTTKLNSSDTPLVDEFVVVGNSGKFKYETGKLINLINMTVLDQTTASNTVWSLLSNLTLNLNNVSTYMVKCELIQYSQAAATGVQLRINTTGTPSLVRTTYTKMSSASAMETFTGTSVSSNTFSATGSSTVQSVSFVDSLVVTDAGSSLWTIELRSETNAQTVHIDKGSYCMVVKVR